MELGKLIKKICVSYPVIYGGSMMATLAFCLVFYPERVFGLDYLAKMLLFSLAGDLPILVFCSGKELSQQEWMGRMILHFVLLEVVLMTFGGIWGLYETFIEGIAFFLIVLLVYIGVRLIVFSDDSRQAEQMNQALLNKKKQK